jgi:hypothetical protein
MSAIRPVADSTATRATLAVGIGVSVVCFVVAMALEFAGRPAGGGGGFDLPAVVRSAAGLEVWGWATLGTFAVILTPAAVLVATAWEYRVIGDRRTALTACAVLLILACGLALALSR